MDMQTFAQATVTQYISKVCTFGLSGRKLKACKACWEQWLGCTTATKFQVDITWYLSAEQAGWAIISISSGEGACDDGKGNGTWSPVVQNGIEAISCATQLDRLVVVKVGRKITTNDNHMFGDNPTWSRKLHVCGDVGVIAVPRAPKWVTTVPICWCL